MKNQGTGAGPTTSWIDHVVVSTNDVVGDGRGNRDKGSCRRQASKKEEIHSAIHFLSCLLLCIAGTGRLNLLKAAIAIGVTRLDLI